MNQFITRVELHDANEGDYEILHEKMEEFGFSRTILSDRNVEYHLPTAEYYFGGNNTPEKVCQLAIKAATKTKRKHSILLSLSSEIYFANLIKV
jgi:hypothetical protein